MPHTSPDAAPAPRPAPSPAAPSPTVLSRGLILSLSVAAGVTVANLYYAQPLAGPISQSFGLDLAEAGLIVTVIQLGYVAGLLFLVPLGDLIENKTLIITTLGALAASLLLAAAAPIAAVFVLASVLLGLTTTATQMIVPLTAHLSPPHQRGQTVGTLMSGLLLGILLARPLSTLLSGFVGWRGVYVLATLSITAIIALMARTLPRRKPDATMSYAGLLRSLWTILRTNPVLQRRAAYQALLFAAFSVFWTASPLLLQQPPFALGPTALSLFLLSGVTGALIAPVAGRLADKGYGRTVTGVAILAVALSFVLAWIGGHGADSFGTAGRNLALAALVAAGIVLDAGVQANMVAGQRAIYALPAEIRSRLNALYLALFFLGGAVGSAVSGYALAHGGIATVSAIGFAFALIAAGLFATEFTAARKPCPT
ncbi:MFS transporter [Afipia sp. P52-10]|uniref:MFS transporter n=1 Tax=Afipia sp. P52-10 TaxID=1429916 RepID=UPI0005559E0D|nr:MFS transporter [Afipia sp. P52-10]